MGLKSVLCFVWCFTIVGCFGGLIEDDYGPGSGDSVMSTGADDMEFVDVGPAVTMSAEGAAGTSSLISPEYPDLPAPAASIGTLLSADYPTETASAASLPSSKTQQAAADDYPDLTQSAGSSDYDVAPSPVQQFEKVPDYGEIKSVVMIIDGERVPDNEFNFIVSLRKDGGHHCGGSVLEDRRTIITAAHCVNKNGVTYPTSILSVVVGVHKLSAATPANIIPVSQVFVHPQWNEEAIVKDIAVLRLARSISDPKVTSVKLPPPDRKPDTGRPLVAAGWGTMKQGPQGGPASDDLMKATLKVADHAVCAQKMGRDSRNPIPDTQICTENEKAGTCQGDSGGPLINRFPAGDFLVGLTSYGTRGCTLGSAAFFTRVSAFSDWIDRVAKGQQPAPPAAPAPPPVGPAPAPAPINPPPPPVAPVPIPEFPAPGPPPCNSGCDAGWGPGGIAVVIVLPGAPTGSCQRMPGAGMGMWGREMGLMCSGRGTTSGGTRCRFTGRGIRCSRSGFMGLYSTGEEAQCFNYEGRRYCPKSALSASTTPPSTTSNADYDQYG
ncbi:transmembrane protease serine 9-like [Paramacrobiotus metropolitanus]|uniref:transmembrane protease serine 9-like n=1 Tax=Paramacrobiotus metropolitanus TaxID=2943436 RepID=UPI0024460461|nr:transmembrane protease serine 9-like [Paramacrobiotus metropolitanus]